LIFIHDAVDTIILLCQRNLSCIWKQS